MLRDLVVLFATALPIVFAFQRLRIPSVVGFIITGVAIGPHALGLIRNTEDVQHLADLGLVMLLFVAGLELSFRSLTRLGRIILWAGAAQITATGALVAGLVALAGWPGTQALFFGFVAVHSSTAIVIKMLADRGELDTPQGQIAAGVLLIQDLSLVPMVLLVRVLAGTEATSWLAVASVLLKAGLAIAVIVVGARVLLPTLLHQIVRLRSREMFTGAIVLFSFGTAWLAAELGLSLALGALIAGLVISESEYSHQAVADIVPFRDTLNSVFFLSIGMLLHVDFLAAHWLPLLAGATGLMALKFVVLLVAIFALQRSLRVAVTAALALGAAGEMAFVLAQFALPTGLISAPQYEAVVGMVTISMVLGPFLISASPSLAAYFQQWLKLPEWTAEAPERAPRGHVLIIGYGLNGENLARVLRQTGIPYLILELNAERITAARRAGEPALWGDGSQLEVLRKAGVASAHVIVVAISDPVVTRRIVALARQENRRVALIVRTRYVAEIDQLRRLGATEVIPEEFETSVEIFARVLRRLRVPQNVIALQVDLIRRQGYGMLRGLALPRQSLDQLTDILAETTTETFLIMRGSPADGQTIRTLGLRRTTGVTIIAVVRDGRPQTNPPAEMEIRAGDVLVLVGSHEQLDRALSALGGVASSEPPAS
jgi:CPA2 family monovalent cation:H+ antiporter-2